MRRAGWCTSWAATNATLRRCQQMHPVCLRRAAHAACARPALHGSWHLLVCGMQEHTRRRLEPDYSDTAMLLPSHSLSLTAVLKAFGIASLNDAEAVPAQLAGSLPGGGHPGP
jgi:hypothetical protein